MLGGLISAALKGAGEGYTTYAKGELENQQKLDYQKQIMQMQEEKELRVDEIMRGRNISDIGKKAGAEAQAKLDTAPTLAAAENAREKAQLQGAMDSGLPQLRAKSATANYDANRDLVVKQNKDKATDDATAQVTKTGTAGYLASLRDETGAKESSSSRAQGALATFQLNQLRAVADARKQLAEEKDPAKREELQQRIQDLQLGTSTKSYSDVVTAGDAYRKMADNLRRDAEKSASTEEERKALLDRAAAYESQADYILSSAIGKRVPGSQGAKPAQNRPAAAPAGAKPWERYQSK